MKLDIWTKLNGKFEQQRNTSDLLLNIDEMVAYFFTHMALFSGDLIATGAPPGVGFGKSHFMTVRDVLECGVTHFLAPNDTKYGAEAEWRAGTMQPARVPRNIAIEAIGQTACPAHVTSS